MQQRNPITIFFLTLITFGIYGIVWAAKTKGEMNRLGAQIPTTWLIIVPFVNLYWYYRYSEGVEKVTANKVSAILSFVLLVLLGVVGQSIIQNEFNKVGNVPLSSAGPSPENLIPAQPMVVDNSFGGPANGLPVTPQATVIAPTSPQPVTVGPVEPVGPTNPPQSVV